MRGERIPQTRPPQASTRGKGARPLRPEFPLDLRGMSCHLENDMILPEQFYRPPDNAHHSPGVAALMCAVLAEALDCFLKGMSAEGQRAQRLAAEAEQWFFTDDHRWPFSFVNVCATLGLEPEYLRLGLKRRRQHCLFESRWTRPNAVRGRHQFKLSA